MADRYQDEGFEVFDTESTHRIARGDSSTVEEVIAVARAKS